MFWRKKRFLDRPPLAAQSGGTVACVGPCTISHRPSKVGLLLLQFSKDGERNRYRKSLNSLVDMSAVNQLAVSWAVSAATIALLGLSAWHDRRGGYRRKRLDESGIEHAFGWLMEFRASLSPADDAAAPAPAARVFPSDQPDAAQLLRLDAALQRIETTKTAAQAGARNRELEPVPGPRV